jgi:flagellar basal-body rod protein FlgC
MIEPISARDIAVSGLRAQRTRMNIIANNIANWETTRTPEGGAFRRQMVVMRGNQIRPGANPDQVGVRVKRVTSDLSPLRPVFQPGHPDANEDGYVFYPNIDLAVEQVDLLAAQRAYEANIAVMVSGSRMRQQAMRIIES